MKKIFRYLPEIMFILSIILSNTFRGFIVEFCIIDNTEIYSVMSTFLITLTGFMLTTLAILLAISNTFLLKKLISDSKLWKLLMNYFILGIFSSFIASIVSLIFVAINENPFFLKTILVGSTIWAITGFGRVLYILILILNNIDAEDSNAIVPGTLK
ncbi:hypothetical protein SDC9_108595 [bioreactor metagenome]|uniref:Uncharacterized protein n=1 Tax=bioreactor metagenome TaxID=1076179 RepID=A0A645B8J0_9ZZZZ